MKETATRAIEFLIDKYDPDFVILYGSIARGDYTEESDIDIALFCESPLGTRDVSVFEGKQLDCWLYSVLEAKPDKSAYLRFAGGELRLDRSGIGKKFLESINSRFKTGPTPITADAREHLVVWTQKMLIRAAEIDIEANYRRTELPCSLLEIYFTLRNYWFTGSKNSFKWLRENDYKTYKLFEKAYSDPTNLSVLKKLVCAVINTQRSVSAV